MNEKDIRDDEIRVIGEEKPTKPKGWKWLLLISAIILVVGFIIWLIFRMAPRTGPEMPPNTVQEIRTKDSIYSVPEIETEHPAINPKAGNVKHKDSQDIASAYSYIEITDHTINDIPLRLYQPHNVTMSLHLGAIDESDPDILFAALAAAVREDNGSVLGEYVLKGVHKANGRSVKGFCAIINDKVTVGVSEDSPLFTEAQEKGGYFFRQYPLVDNGKLVENNPKGKSIRRALCERNGEIFTVETLSKESFHDFAQALVDLGVDNAIYLLGSTAYGWAIDKQGQRHEFGELNTKWENRNYLVMRKKS